MKDLVVNGPEMMAIFEESRLRRVPSSASLARSDSHSMSASCREGSKRASFPWPAHLTACADV